MKSLVWCLEVFD